MTLPFISLRWLIHRSDETMRGTCIIGRVEQESVGNPLMFTVSRSSGCRQTIPICRHYPVSGGHPPLLCRLLPQVMLMALYCDARTPRKAGTRPSNCRKAGQALFFARYSVHFLGSGVQSLESGRIWRKNPLRAPRAGVRESADCPRVVFSGATVMAFFPNIKNFNIDSLCIR